MLTLFNSLIRSRLEYCSQVWDPVKIKHIDAIENIQRKFTRKINGMHDLDYWARLKELNLMSLQRRREKLSILLVWKIKNNHIPNVVNLEFKKNPRNLKVKAILKPMPKVVGKCLSLYENSFCIKSAKLWNTLPSHLTEILDLNTFEKNLELYLKLFPDQPPSMVITIKIIILC